ncbi:MAG TPA: GWxTD domain-containing protein, partial [Thermoanaerobaculia bacterium]|nr:GWxTD domain-containing protein [Thermoanaerobaculia bacterium]
MKSALSVALLALSSFGAAQSAPPPVAAPPPAASVTPVSKNAALAALPDEERKWITEYVAPIVLPEEEKLFLELTEPHQREIFKEDFWARRERPSLPAPLGPGYRYRYEELRGLVDATYDGWRSDAGRMVLRFGEPGSLDKTSGCERTFRDLEIWTYNNIPGRGSLRQFFYRPTPMAPRKLWTVGTRDSDVFQPGSCRKSFPELVNDCNPPPQDKCYGTTCLQACDVFRAWSEIRSRQGSEVGGMAEAADLLRAEPISMEGMEKVRDRFAGLGTPDAKPIGVEGPSGTAPSAPAGPAS